MTRRNIVITKHNRSGTKEEVLNGSYAQKTEQHTLDILSFLKTFFWRWILFFIFCMVVKNTVTWYLQRHWGISPNFLQQLWNSTLDYAEEDPVTLWVCGPVIVFLTVYWTLGTMYLLLDIINLPRTMMKYKIQPGTNEPIAVKHLAKGIWLVLINQIIVTSSLAYLVLPVIEMRGYPPFRELPNFYWVLFQIPVFFVVQDGVFYYSHRILHSKYFYKSIHKLHHDWTSPIAISAVYAHPVEHAISNIFPPFLGPFLMGSHVVTYYLWYMFISMTTIQLHCGYHLPFLPSSEEHDYHHSKSSQTYSMFGLMDRIHGTDRKFKATPGFSRHFINWSLKPVREIYPDVPQN